jgi:FixJ family two-component response regulator
VNGSQQNLSGNANSGAPETLPRESLARGDNRRSGLVFLLDDDPSVLRSTGRLLDSQGWQVEGFTDPFAFLARAAQVQPDVAVLDVLMPKLNGLEAQRRLREVSPSTRVIILTSKDNPVVRARALEAGASAFFLKATEQRELLAGIEAAAAQI